MTTSVQGPFAHSHSFGSIPAISQSSLTPRWICPPVYWRTRPRCELQALLLGKQVFAEQHLRVLTGRRGHDGSPPETDAALPRLELREELLGNSVCVRFDLHGRRSFVATIV